MVYGTSKFRWGVAGCIDSSREQELDVAEGEAVDHGLGREPTPPRGENSRTGRVIRSVADMTTWIEELKRSEYEAPT